MTQRRICLVSPGHVASNPRLVKEADALQAAGFQVRVVAGNYMAAIQPLDQTILSEAAWSYKLVDLGTKAGYLSRRVLQEGAKKVASIGWLPHLSVATWAHSPVSWRLARAAMAEPADLYIAHCLAALPAAAIAAQQHQAPLGFDAEDFHMGELTPDASAQCELRVRDYIERTLLPRCRHLTAASPLIAEAYRQRYGVKMQPILNVFPLSDAPPSVDWHVNPSSQTSSKQHDGTEPSLYWFSQTIGPGRGLESIIRAMGTMRVPARLYLRGLISDDYETSLRRLAAVVGMGDRLEFLPTAPPAEMVRLAAEHDIGLSLELTEPLNRALCLTNKIFVYLLAGLPVVMSNTPAQEKLSQQLGEAALMIGEAPEEIAVALDHWLIDPLQLKQRRKIAWELGQSVYNWDLEQQDFLNSVEKIFR